MNRALIDDVNGRVARDLGGVLSKFGYIGGSTRWSRQSRGYIVCHHGERTPSCSVQVRDGVALFNCHACGARGDFLDLAAEHFGRKRSELPGLLRDVTNFFGWPNTNDAPPRAVKVRSRASDIPRPMPDDAPPLPLERYNVLACAILAYARRMPAMAQRYLEARGLFAHAQAVGVTALPADPSRLFDALRSEGFSARELELAGIGWPGGTRLAFPDHLLVVPWRNELGKITVLQRRHLTNRAANARTPKYLFPRGFRAQDPFGADLFAEAMRDMGGDASVVFVEGALDALARRKIASINQERCVVLGLPSATTFDPAWSRFGAGHDVLLALDSDGPGNGAVERLRRHFADARSLARDWPPFGAKDWGEALSIALGENGGTT